jgi:hypothetical protein
MSRLTVRTRRGIRRALLIGSLCAVFGFSTADVAWAKPHVEKTVEKPVKSYVFPYAITILGVALGLILVLRPVKRDNEPKRNVKEEQ